MPEKFSTLARRATAKDANGRLLLLVTGEETDQALKDLIMQICLQCPLNLAHFHCPFHILGSLSHTSLNSTVQGMSREACLNLFELELECRTSHAGECRRTQPPSA